MLLPRQRALSRAAAWGKNSRLALIWLCAKPSRTQSCMATRRTKPRKVEVTFNCLEHALEIEVKDQGEGFDPTAVPDPTDPANILKTSGRGIFLMRSFMDEVDWLARPEGGTKVRLVKKF